jgi:excisionase family DNA binding protein
MEKLYTTKQVVDLLMVSKHTLAGWCSHGLISYRRFGKTRRFTEGDIKAFIESRKREAL